MRKVLRSFGHAKEGFIHALRHERNFRLFTLGYICILILGWFQMLTHAEWAAILIAGGTFMGIELLNTALEHLVDAIDELRKNGHENLPWHAGLKATKDTAAAASLMSLIAFVAIAVIIFGPRLLF